MDNRIIVALDDLSRETALALASDLQGLVWGFKVNDLLLECGVEIITKLKDFGQVFADPKLHDIPNTVANGVRRLAGAGADLITVHASGGSRMIADAVSAATPARILAITVLTSLNEQDSMSLFRCAPDEAVLSLARLARYADAHGVVCSPEELSLLKRQDELSGLLKVAPGIRPSWYETRDDQQRTRSPAKALADGADLIVVGRPITKHKNPVDAVRLIREELT